MLIPWRLDKYSYDREQPTTYKVLLTNQSGANVQNSYMQIQNIPFIAIPILILIFL